MSQNGKFRSTSLNLIKVGYDVGSMGQEDRENQNQIS